MRVCLSGLPSIPWAVTRSLAPSLKPNQEASRVVCFPIPQSVLNKDGRDCDSFTTSYCIKWSKQKIKHLSCIKTGTWLFLQMSFFLGLWLKRISSSHSRYFERISHPHHIYRHRQCHVHAQPRVARWCKVMKANQEPKEKRKRHICRKIAQCILRPARKVQISTILVLSAITSLFDFRDKVA